MRKLLLVLPALAAMAGGVATQRWLASQAVAENQASLQAAFPDLAGNLHRLDEWKGQVLVVNFWASWCPPCVEEMPAFSKLQNEFGGKVQFVGIFIDDEAQYVREFLQANPVSYPILDGSLGGRDWAAKQGNDAGVLPYSVVFDASGRRVHVEVGRFSRDEVLARIRPLLANP